MDKHYYCENCATEINVKNKIELSELELITQHGCDYFKYNYADIVSKSSKHKIVRIRYFIIYYMVMCGYTYTKIANFFFYKHHTSVGKARQEVDNIFYIMPSEQRLYNEFVNTIN